MKRCCAKRMAANNQIEAAISGLDTSGNLDNSPFHEPLRLADQMVIMLDRRGLVRKRIWVTLHIAKKNANSIP